MEMDWAVRLDLMTTRRPEESTVMRLKGSEGMTGVGEGCGVPWRRKRDGSIGSYEPSPLLAFAVWLTPYSTSLSFSPLLVAVAKVGKSSGGIRRRQKAADDGNDAQDTLGELFGSRLSLSQAPWPKRASLG
ncbi:hypothetical protein Droror1_Dr00016098 [Drosera rotundifolia]